jgi:EpsI family protein
MQKNTLYSLSAALLLLLTFTINRAAGRLPVPTLKRVDLSRVPRQIGVWTCFQDLPETEHERIAAPNAEFHRWLYRNPAGQEVELLLETSTDPQMFHTPTQCMPAQQWDIEPVRRVAVQAAPGAAVRGQDGNVMRMKNGADRELLLYWYTSERQLDKIQQLIDKLLAGHPSTRLFVRVRVNAAAGYDNAEALAQQFATAALPPLTEIEKSAQR